MKYYLNALKQYTSFTGRARRTEFWMFILIHLAIVIFLSLIMLTFYSDKGINTLFVFLLPSYLIVTFLPALAITTRRLHDTEKSGWLMLIQLLPFGRIILIIFLATEGTPGINKYGPDPKSNPIDLDEFGTEEFIEYY